MLKDFTLYLLEQKLEEASVQYLRYIKEAKLTHLGFYDHLEQEQVLQLARTNVTNFFRAILEDTAIEASRTLIHQWASQQMPEHACKYHSASDLIYHFTLRKQLYIDFLPDYTTDIVAGMKIIKALEELSAQIHSCALEAYAAIQLEKEKYAKDFAEQLVRNSSEGIVAYDRSGKIMVWNQAMESICGIRAADAIEKDIFTIYKNFINEEEAKALELVWQGQRTTLLNLPFTIKKGYYNIDLVPIVYKEEIIGGVNYIQDITARKEAEIALDKERSYLLAILENMREQVIACNEKGEFHYFNKAARSLHAVDNINIPVNEWASFFKLYKPNTDELLAEDELPLIRALRGERLRNVPISIIGADGIKREIFYNGQQILSTDGQVIGALVVLHDVTARIMAEKQLQQQNQSLLNAYEELRKTQWALEESNALLENKVVERTKELEDIARQVQQREQQLNLVINAVPALISYVDAGYRYRFVNDAYLNWFGITTNEIIGRKVSEFLEGKVRVNTNINHTRALQGETVEAQLSLLNKHGEWRDTEIRYIPHINAEGNVLGFIILAIDLTENIKARTELAAKNEELQVINTDLDSFIYTASHDLKAPILNLEGLFTALNKRLEANYGSTEMMISQMITDSIEKFKTTIKQLTEITKAQKDIELQKELITFRQVIDDVLLDMRPLVMEANPELNIQLQVEQIFFAPKNLRSIVYNLLSNAIKYRSEHRPLSIFVRTYQEGEFVVLQVQDNGLGIEPRQLPKLFTMFKRLHSHVEGTGVGLYIIKRIIENTGGKIEVASKPNEGTTFRAYLR